MSAQSPVPKDDPLMVTWEEYKTTDDYANTRKWAFHDAHCDGSLWAAYSEGWRRAQEALRAELAGVRAALREALSFCDDAQHQDTQYADSRERLIRASKEPAADALRAAIAASVASAVERERADVRITPPEEDPYGEGREYLFVQTPAQGEMFDIRELPPKLIAAIRARTGGAR